MTVVQGSGAADRPRQQVTLTRTGSKSSRMIPDRGNNYLCRGSSHSCRRTTVRRFLHPWVDNCPDERFPSHIDPYLDSAFAFADPDNPDCPGRSFEQCWPTAQERSLELWRKPFQLEVSWPSPELCTSPSRLSFASRIALYSRNLDERARLTDRFKCKFLSTPTNAAHESAGSDGAAQAAVRCGAT